MISPEQTKRFIDIPQTDFETQYRKIKTQNVQLEFPFPTRYQPRLMLFHPRIDLLSGVLLPTLPPPAPQSRVSNLYSDYVSVL